MPFVITDPCIGTKDTACVDVCPVDCIHPRTAGLCGMCFPLGSDCVGLVTSSIRGLITL